MSILIKGMKMPARCELCPFSGISGKSCELVSCPFTGEHRYFNDGQYLEDCPLIEVPPHGMLIDVDKLEKGCFYGVGTDGVFYKLYPRIKLPLAKKINVETGEIIYPTNADRIRAMSDEELAKFIERTMFMVYESVAKVCRMVGYAGQWDSEGIIREEIEWLKQEIET